MSKNLITDTIIEACAASVHEANRQFQKLANEPVAPAWAEIDELGQQAIMAAVEDVLVNKRHPRMAHEAWRNTMVADGWTPGEKLDRDKKQNPNVRSWEQLKPTVRAKYSITIQVAKALCDVLLSYTSKPAE